MNVDDLLNKIIIGSGQYVTKESDDYKKAKYSLEILKENAIRFIITGAIALFFHVWWYFIFFAIIYGILKSHAYGIHMKSSVMCTVSGILVYYGSIYLAKIYIDKKIYIILFILCFLIHLKYAPAVSKYQWAEKERIKRLKYRLAIIILLMFVVQFFLPFIYSNLVLCALISSTLNILPISFKIFES